MENPNVKSRAIMSQAAKAEGATTIESTRYVEASRVGYSISEAQGQ
jgi:hypothetical protein